MRAKTFGGILIEFAFSVPVLIILMFFVLDHYRYYELQNKVRSSAYYAASMVQQLGNLKTNKKLTTNDLGMITYASFLNFCSSAKDMYNPYKYGCIFGIYYTYVKRINSNSYTFQNVYSYPRDSYSTSKLRFNSHINDDTKTAAQIKAISEDLLCDNDGEERVFVRAYYHRTSSYSPSKEKLGFFILPLKNDPSNNAPEGKVNTLFQHGIVITPKPGLFPVTN